MSDTADVLDALAAYYRRFVVLTDDQLCALVLWTAHTYVYEIADTTPYLIVTSAEKRSGKTRVIEAVQHVAHAPRTVAALTGPILFRVITKEKPTLLIDETDAIFRDNRGGPSERQEEIRSLLNAGYRRGTLVPRMLAGNQDYSYFDVFGPKLLAGIGHLPETIEDRGVNVRLVRKRPQDEIERFRFREVSNGTTQALRDALGEWAPGARLALEGVFPEMPDELDDRAQDAYELLVAIGDRAGEEWGGRTRAALVALRSENIAHRESPGVRLLNDVVLCADKLARLERIHTVDLLALLYSDGEQPWEEWWGESGGKKAARRLALTLAEYGLQPMQMKLDGVNRRGYQTAPLLEVVARYTGTNTLLTLPGSESGSTMPVSGGSVLSESEAPGSVLKTPDLQGGSVSSVLDAPQEGSPDENALFKPSDEWEW